MASSHLPVVPPEIWKTVLENCNSMKDLIHLWTQCRQVSTQFKADVESAFIKQHLPVLSLLFDVKSLRQEHFKDETHVDPKYHIHQVYNVYTTSYFPDTRYIGLSKERKTALFSARTEEELAAWTNPPMTLSSCTNVQLREHSHCVEVRCRYELRKGELVFELDWKEMLEQLLQEGAAALGNWRPRSQVSQTRVSELAAPAIMPSLPLPCTSSAKVEQQHGTLAPEGIFDPKGSNN